MATETFYFRPVDENGDPIAGIASQISVRIRREADQRRLDFDDLAFKLADDVTSLYATPTEDADEAGTYLVPVVVTTWTAGKYMIDADFDGLSAPACITFRVKGGAVL